MVEKTSNDVFHLIEERGAIGTVLEALKTSSVPRTKENYLLAKERLLAYPSGVTSIDVLQKYLEQALEREELVLVLFRKMKKNGKIGHRKEFKKGFCYYIGMDPGNLTKVYFHWKEEKKFLLKNIASLKSKSFWMDVDHHVINCGFRVFCMNISLFNPEKTVLEAEISLYAGYSTSKN